MATANEERQTALNTILEAEIQKMRQAEAEQQRREAESDALNKQIQAANEAFEAEKVKLAAKMNYLLKTQIKWRSRFTFVMDEVDELHNEQATIQNEINKLIADTQNLVYTAKQAGAQIADTQTVWDSIGGDSESLVPYPPGVSNSIVTEQASWQNRIARFIFAGKVYSPARLLDGRRR